MIKWFNKNGNDGSNQESKSADTNDNNVLQPDNAADEMLRRIESASLPDYIYDVARDECERLHKADGASPEFALGHNYLEFLLSLPWNTTTKDDLDLERAKEVLDARHYGLNNVKERILEFLAVKSLRSRISPNLIIADDEVIARENLAIIFEHEGFAVRTVANGLEAIAAMEEDPADIVITDLKMDGMDGLELLGEMRSRWPDTGVIMLTGYATVKTAVTAMKKGADQYMGKPVNLTKLRDYVQELLGKNQRIQGLRGPVLCFSGPPGTGKTSIGKAIAEAMGRKFICMSLAGLRDEAELRGHRRTYVGAMAGRLLQNIQKSGVRNPVIMLDEMDKIIQSFEGDATSVLLEILDPQQNSTFVDQYLGQAFDLSGVLFIATANIMDRISAPLRDRMEVIEFSSYTLSEKLKIATNYLVPEQLQQHGLRINTIDIQPEALKSLIIDYTREPGLRGLEKQIASLCRKLARRVLDESGSSSVVAVGVKELLSLMGPPPHFTATARKEPGVGLATGLVWSENGGEIIFVEAAKMYGNKNLILTGSLGDVLQESAQTALSFIRANVDNFGLSPDFFESSDIHVHIPAGSVTKEGPSAGVTIAVAILSQLTGRYVPQDMAFSGEISLHGDVLPVGGVREKIMAASRAGIRTVVLPEQCSHAVQRIEQEVLDGIDIRLVSSLSQVMELAFI
ncbi:S16 family serine protease [Maridesulfovibrio zosterae]|uniref:S16 family serine protease n=1 Tax=Maridesulfovibrio zosterae TaxID=82171 RepID=UPI000A0763EC|nr:S16 family serine protease [Maridesulfovibrio zosterae]